MFLGPRVISPSVLHAGFLATWSNGDKATGLTLSGGSLIVTNGNADLNNYGVRCTHSRSAGKWYFEATMTTDGRQCVGVANSSWAGIAAPSVNTHLGNDVNGVGYAGETGDVRFNGVAVTDDVVAATGDVIQVAVDFDAKLFWAKRVSDANWNDSPSRNPATGAGGVSFAAGSGPWFPALSSRWQNSIGTLNVGATAFVGSRPFAFLPYNG